MDFSNNILQGDKIRLTGLNYKDVPIIACWYEDTEFLRLLDARPAYPQAELLLNQWLEEKLKANDAFIFGVRLNDSEELIGIVEFEGIIWTNQVGWVSLAIGNRNHWGKGYGYEAMVVALRFAFQELNLYRIQLTVFSYNERAIRLYEKLGFQREGVYRKFLGRDGKRYDMYLYGLLLPEWKLLATAS